MKKNYVIPKIEIMEVSAEYFMAASPVGVSSDDNDVIDDGNDILSKEHDFQFNLMDD